MSAKLNFYRRTLPKLCIDFSSNHGKEIFKDAMDGGYMNAYFKLGPQLRTQDEPAYCGLSSLVMVLNALAVDPGKVWKGVWRWYHEDMLECCTSLEEIKVNGLHIQQLSCIAKCNQLESKVVYADENLTAKALRNEIKTVCESVNSVMVVSFGRKILGQTGSGHFAPVGGYNPKEDLVLLLEPARFKYPPFWVTLPLLLEAMQSIDNATGKPRGYLSLKKSDSQPTLLFHIAKALNVFRPVCDEFNVFIDDILSYLKQKAPQQASIAIIVRDASHKLSDLSSFHKESSRSLFFTTTKQSDVDQLSPEHQQAVSLLIESIEKTEIYQLVVKQGSNCCTRYNRKDDFKREVNRIECGSTICRLCFPHYVTLLFCMLPVFSPNSANQMMSCLALTDEQYIGSNMEWIVKFVEKVLGEIKTFLREEEGSNTSFDDEETERRFHSSQLFLNEIDQLQAQMRHLVNVGSQNVCCGHELHSF